MDFLERHGFRTPAEKSIGTFLLTILAAFLIVLILILTMVFIKAPILLTAAGPAVGVYVFEKFKEKKNE